MPCVALVMCGAAAVVTEHVQLITESIRTFISVFVLSGGGHSSVIVSLSYARPGTIVY